MIQLQPGTYEIGREDGSVDPFLIVIGADGAVVGATMVTYELFQEAVRSANGNGPSWWFRWVGVPDFCPVISPEGEM